MTDEPKRITKEDWDKAIAKTQKGNNKGAEEEPTPISFDVVEEDGLLHLILSEEVQRLILDTDGARSLGVMLVSQAAIIDQHNYELELLAQEVQAEAEEEEPGGN